MASATTPRARVSRWNLLTDEEAVDALSGNGVLNGIPVEIAPASGS